MEWVVEHPVRVTKGRAKFPPIDALKSKGKPVAQAGEWKVLLQCRDDEVHTFLSWIDDTMPHRCIVLGIFAWEEMDVRIDREFKGLVIYFKTPVDAVHFRLAWSDFHMPSTIPAPALAA